jgi:hypothetical protein
MSKTDEARALVIGHWDLVIPWVFGHWALVILWASRSWSV